MQATANYPGEAVVLGGGFGTVTPRGTTASRPTNAGTGWTVSADNTTTTPFTNAYAVGSA